MRRAIVNSLGVSERSDRSEVGTQARETLSHRGSASRMGIVRGPLAITRECLRRAHSRNQLAGGRSDLRVIDCGCGTGHNLRLLAPYGRAVGFDLTPLGAAASRRAGWPAVRADITRIPFASQTFDIATSFDVLQCVELDEAARRRT